MVRSFGFRRVLLPTVAVVSVLSGVLTPLSASAAVPPAGQTVAGNPANNPPLPVEAAKLRSGDALSSTGGTWLSTGLPYPAPLPANTLTAPDGSSAFNAKTSKLVSTNEFGSIFQNSDGSKTQQISPEPVNMQDSSGAWVPISTTVVKKSDGSFTVSNNPLSPTFAPTATSIGGMFSVSSGGHNVSFTLQGATAVAAGIPSAVDQLISGATANTGVSYPAVLPGADMVYSVDPGDVSDTLVLAAPPVSLTPTYVWTIHAPGLTAAKDVSGNINLSDSSGVVVVQIPAPVMTDSSGIDQVRGPATANIATTLAPAVGVSGDWVLTLTPDPTWLDSPARVYPVGLDPGATTVNEGEAGQNAYESNGTHLTGYTNIGNSRAGGDTYWRTVEGYAYNQVFGNELTGADVVEQYAGSGTTNAAGSSFWYASCFGYNCTGTFLSSATISSGGSGYGVQSNPALYNWMASAVDNQNTGEAFLVGGDEIAGSYTYKKVSATMQLAYVPMPTIAAVAQSFTGGYEISPQDGGTGSNAPVLQISGGTTSNSALNYNFIVSNSSGAQVWQSGWTASTSVQVPSGTLAGATAYTWKAVAQDGYLAAGNHQVTTANYSWTTSTTPTIPSGSVAFSPSDSSIVASTSPTLTAPTLTGASGQTLTYALRVASGRDGVSGQLAQSAQLAASAGAVSWQVPNSTLHDGGAYTWTEVVGDQYGSSWVEPVNRLTVSMRVVNPGPAPVDSAGPVTVNLANGNVATSFTSPTVATVGGAMGFSFNYNSEAATNAGLTATYYTDPGVAAPFSWSAAVPQVSRVDPQINFNWNTTAPAPNLATVTNGVAGAAVNFQTTWTGFITPPAGSYNFGFTSDDGVQLYLNNSTTPTIDYWTNPPWTTPTFGTSSAQTLVVTAGSGSTPNTATLGGVTVPLPLPITVKYYQVTGPAYINFLVEPTGNASAAQSVPPSWLTTTATTLPTGWQSSAAIAGDAGSYVSASNQGGYVTLTDVSGGTHTYTQTLTNGVPNGGYTPPAGETGVLSLDAAGTLTFSDESGVVYLFNTAGQVTQVIDPQDSTKPATPVPTYVTSATQASLLRSVADPVSSNRASPPVYGKQVLFGYSSDTVQSLTANTSSPSTSTANACTVPTGFSAAPPGMICVIQYPDGSQTQLLYDANGNLTRMIDPGGTQSDFGYTQVGPTGQQWWALNTIVAPLQNDWLAYPFRDRIRDHRDHHPVRLQGPR